MLIVHARGTSYPQVLAYLKQVKGGFFHDANEQEILHKLEPITNGVTISNIASFETGSLPSKHGVIGHNFAAFREGRIRLVNGFSVRFEKETFWEKADKNGKTVLKLGALTLHGKYEDHDNVDCVAQGYPTSGSRMLTLVPSKEDQELIKYEIAPSSSPLLLKDSTEIKFYRNQAATSILLDRDYNEENGTIGELNQNEWLQVTENSPGELTNAFSIKWESVIGDTLVFYKRASYVNRGYPQEFLLKVDNGAGPAPGWPNIPYYSANRISRETLVDEISTEMAYIMKSFEVATKNKEYDLIYIDYPAMDRYGHAMLGEDPSVFKSMFEQMDSNFNCLQEFCEENNYELIITSGHGFSAIHTSVDLNQFLVQNGIEADPRKENWEAVGAPGKVSSHIYFNPELSASEKKVLMNKITGRLRGMVDDRTKDSVIEKIVRKSELNEVGLDHTKAGDLFLLLKPGYVFANTTQKSVFDTPIFKGDHGYSLRHEDSYGFAYSKKKCDPCKTHNVSNLVLETLDVN